MLLRWLCASLLILIMQNVTADRRIDSLNYDMIYYNPITRLGLHAELEDANRQPLSQARIVFRGMACNCEGLVCGCCSGINLTIFNFDRHVCTNFTYVPDEFAIKLAVLMNETVIYTNLLTAKNPPPLCAPFPYLPVVTFCVRIFDIYTPGKNLHACLDFETRVVNWPVLILHFNCIKIGEDGISWTKPEDGSNVLQLQTEVSEPEVYDEVNFEQQSELQVNQTSNLTPEEENNIGQLKL